MGVPHLSLMLRNIFERTKREKNAQQPKKGKY